MTYTLPVSKLELVLLTDVLDYVIVHFEAEDAETAEMFRLTCEELRTKLITARHEAGLPDVPCPVEMMSAPERQQRAQFLATEPSTKVH